MLPCTSVPDRLRNRARLSRLLGGSFCVHRPQLHFLNASHQADHSQEALIKGLVQLLYQGFHASVIVASHQPAQNALARCCNILVAAADLLVQQSIQVSAQLAVSCRFEHNSRSVDLFSALPKHSTIHRKQCDGKIRTSVRVASATHIRKAFKLAASHPSTSSSVSTPDWIAGTACSSPSFSSSNVCRSHAVIAHLWYYANEDSSSCNSNIKVTTLPCSGCLTVIDISSCCCTTFSDLGPAGVSSTAGSDPSDGPAFSRSAAVGLGLAPKCLTRQRTAQAPVSQSQTLCPAPGAACTPVQAANSCVWLSLAAYIHTAATNRHTHSTGACAPRLASTGVHRLVQQIAPYILGPVCCHWLISKAATPAAAPVVRAAPAGTAWAQLPTGELLPVQAAQQQLQSVLQEALTIETVCEKYSADFEQGPWQQLPCSPGPNSSRAASSNKVGSIQHIMLSFQDFVESRKSRPSSAGQLQRSRSAHHQPNASHPLLLALDNLEQPGSSTAKAHSGNTADTAAAAAAAAASLATGLVGDDVSQPELHSSFLSAKWDSPVGTAPGCVPGQQACAVQSSSASGFSPAGEHASSDRSSSHQLLSRSSTLKAVHTTTTVTEAGVLSCSSSQHRQSSENTPTPNARGLIQPITVADALARPDPSRSRVQRADISAAAAPQGAPPSTGRRYAAATAVSSAERDLGGCKLMASQQRSLTNNSQRSLGAQSSSKSMKAPSDAAKAAALHALHQQQEKLRQMVHQASLRSRASTPSRLSVRSLSTVESTAAVAAGQPEAVQAFAVEAAAVIMPVVAAQNQAFQQPQQPEEAVVSADAQQQQQQRRAALQHLQQQLDSMQSSFRSRCSRQSSVSASTARVDTSAAAAVEAAQQSSAQAVTGVSQESRPDSSASTPSPRAMHPQPYAAAAATSGQPSATLAGLKKPAVQQVSSSQDTLKAQTVVDYAAAAAAAAAGEHSPELPGTSQPAVCATPLAQAMQALDVTFCGAVPAAEASARTDDNAYSPASESDLSFQASPRSPRACSSGLFIEPSSTSAGSGDARASLVDAADQGYFKTPAADMKRPRQSSQHKLQQVCSVGTVQAQQHCEALVTSESSSMGDCDWVGDGLSALAGHKQTHSSKQQCSQWHSQPSCSDASFQPDAPHGNQSHQGCSLGHHVMSGKDRVHERVQSPHSPRSALAAVAAGSGSDSHMVLVARQHAKQLQQQNDALVRVLEREQEEQKRAKQQAVDAQQQLAESRAEWEVKLQVLRQDKAALHAQLRRAMAGGNQLEVLDAYDAALQASAAKVEEAQAAAAALAAQLADAELQQQSCSHSTPDAALAVAAMESHAARSGAYSNKHNINGPLAALRQHQKHLEQQLAKQQAELTKLQRENIRLMRFKKQFDAAAQKLRDTVAAQVAAEEAAHQAGLKAAAEAGKASRLQQQVDKLLRERQQMQAAQQVQQQQMQAFQQQLQELQCDFCCSSPGAARVAGSQAYTDSSQAASAPQTAAGRQHSCRSQSSSRSKQSSRSAAAVLAGTSVGPQLQSNTATGREHTSTCMAAGDHASSSGRQRLKHSQSMVVGSSTWSDADSNAAPRKLRSSASTPPARDGNRGAMVLAQQAANALPATDVALKEHMSSLMSAIAAGAEERKALAAQGQVLLDMVTGAL